MISALTVSIAGTIGWVGLLIPHIVRMMLGPANSRVLPASIILGATFLILADCVSRCIADEVKSRWDRDRNIRHTGILAGVKTLTQRVELIWMC